MSKSSKVQSVAAPRGGESKSGSTATPGSAGTRKGSTMGMPGQKVESPTCIGGKSGMC